MDRCNCGRNSIWGYTVSWEYNGCGYIRQQCKGHFKESTEYFRQRKIYDYNKPNFKPGRWQYFSTDYIGNVMDGNGGELVYGG
jgi:hypothetical protein